MRCSPVNGTVALSTSFSLRNTRLLIACLTVGRPLVRPAYAVKIKELYAVEEA